MTTARQERRERIVRSTELPAELPFERVWSLALALMTIRSGATRVPFPLDHAVAEAVELLLDRGQVAVDLGAIEELVEDPEVPLVAGRRLRAVSAVVDLVEGTARTRAFEHEQSTLPRSRT